MKLLPIKRFIISGESMLPTLSVNQEVLVWCWFLKIKIGDLVVFKKNGKSMVKRVQKIKEKSVYVVGNNPHLSTDSRVFGWIGLNEILGKVIKY